MAGKKREVVVVGGGVGGAHAAKYLEDHAHVLLLDPKDHFEIPYGQPRCIVEPEFAEKCLVLHSDYLKTAKHQKSMAESLNSELITNTGERIPYDFLVIATGSSFSEGGSTTKAECISHYQSENKKLKDANTVLVVGGGPVGVELAGEVAVDFPQKKTILVHSGRELLEFLGPRAGKKALSWLTSKKVEVLLNERIDLTSLPSSPSSNVYTTSSGRKLEADCPFICIGKKVGSSWLRESIIKENLNEYGRLNVDDYLRVKGQPNIFAIGDITSIKEIKQGFLAERHARVVADNIKRLSKDPNSELIAYKPLTSPLGMVSLGRHVALLHTPLFTFVGWLAGMLKSKDLFVGKTRKGLGLNS